MDEIILLNAGLMIGVIISAIDFKVKISSRLARLEQKVDDLPCKSKSKCKVVLGNGN